VIVDHRPDAILRGGRARPGRVLAHLELP
jgi:hypothetical protein